jgi:hypothetical protein
MLAVAMCFSGSTALAEWHALQFPAFVSEERSAETADPPIALQAKRAAHKRNANLKK